MAFSTLLEIITDLIDETGICARQSTIVGNTGLDARRLLAFANSAGRDLMRVHEWSILQTSGTVTTANGTADYTLASNYDRMISDTGWNRTQKRFLIGPDTPQVNRWLNDGYGAAASINQRFRIKGTTITIWPTPTAIETLGYEYISNKWALSSTSVGQTMFLADNDTSVFDPSLLKKEIRWRFIAGKGLFADALKAEADQLRDDRIAADLGGTVLAMEGQGASPFIGMANLPDSDWNI